MATASSNGHVITATAEASSARVRLDLTGGAPGQPAYVVRQDGRAAVTVRASSTGALLWVAAVQRANLAPNPSAEVSLAGLTDHVEGAPTGVVRERVADTGVVGSWAFRAAGTLASADRVGWYFDVAASPGQLAHVSVSARMESAVAGAAAGLRAEWRSDAASLASFDASNATTAYSRLSVPVSAAPAGTTTLRVYLRLLGPTTTGAVAARWDGILVELGSTAPGLGSYFDGATATAVGATRTYHRWTGAAHVSTSEAVTTSLPPVYDDEARQGLDADYIVSDEAGASLVSVRLSVPRWGTWLKSPGRPFLNMPCLLHSDTAASRPAEVAVLRPRGARLPVALSDVRAAPSGRVSLLTRTAEQARSMAELLADGQVLMLDVDSALGVPWRYISVQSVSESRAAGSAFEPARVWELDAVEVAAPVGVAAGAGFTFADLATRADTFQALSAHYATFSDMAADVPV